MLNLQLFNHWPISNPYSPPLAQNIAQFSKVREIVPPVRSELVVPTHEASQSHLTSHFSSFRGCALLFYLSLLAIQFSGYWHEFTRFSGCIFNSRSHIVYPHLSSTAHLTSIKWKLCCILVYSCILFKSTPITPIYKHKHLYTYTWLIFRISNFIFQGKSYELILLLL